MVLLTGLQISCKLKIGFYISRLCVCLLLGKDKAIALGGRKKGPPCPFFVMTDHDNDSIEYNGG